MVRCRYADVNCAGPDPTWQPHPRVKVGAKVSYHATPGDGMCRWPRLSLGRTIAFPCWPGVQRGPSHETSAQADGNAKNLKNHFFSAGIVCYHGFSKEALEE